MTYIYIYTLICKISGVYLLELIYLYIFQDNIYIFNYETARYGVNAILSKVGQKFNTKLKFQLSSNYTHYLEVEVYSQIISINLIELHCTPSQT